MFEKNQFLVLEMESPLDRDRYVTTLEFSGAYVADMRGMYKASFKYKNGTESWVYNSTERQHFKFLLSFARVQILNSNIWVKLIDTQLFIVSVKLETFLSPDY